MQVSIAPSSKNCSDVPEVPSAPESNNCSDVRKVPSDPESNDASEWCRKQRSAFDQVSEFDRGRIVAYRDCGLSFRKIGSRAGRNQITVRRICDRWVQEGT
ncbi:transposable element Tc1 transposase [Trichonephila clavipes]|nr:transposable element Tc1 transposase [Trichonephila clavipes]